MGTVGENYVETTIPAVNKIWTIRRNMISVRRYLNNIIIVETQEDYDRVVDSFNTDLAALNSAMEELVTLAPQFKTNLDKVKELMTQAAPIRAEIMELAQKFEKTANSKAYDLYLHQYAPIFDQAADVVLEIHNSVEKGIQTRSDLAKSTEFNSTLLVTAILILSILLTIVAIIIITKALSKPIKEIESAMEAMAAGDLKNAVITYESKDELGLLSNSIRKTISTVSFIIEDLSTSLKEVGQGNFLLSSQNKKYYIGDFKPLSDSLEKIVQELSDTLIQINQAANQVASGSGQVSNGAQVLSEGATEQASAIEELTATITGISNQVSENAENAENSNKKASLVGNETEMSNERMKEMLLAMGEINDSSQQIENIIKTIEDIATQTNLLSLNASIEAARAGEAGKGFAVVANEISELAGKSAQASKSTSDLIQISLKAVENGTRIANETAKTLETVVSGVNEVCSTIYKISEASKQQAHSMGQVTSGVEQISSVVQNNSATAQESAAASEELDVRSDMLKALINKFKLKKV